MKFDRAQVALRAKKRAEILLPGGTFAVFFPDEDAGSADADLVCVVGAPDSTGPAGYVRVVSRGLKTYVPLGELVGGVVPAARRWFGDRGIFAHVGSRLCGKRCPGMAETYWVRPDREADLSRDAKGWEMAAVFFATVCGIGFTPAVGATLASFLTCVAATAVGLAAGWAACGSWMWATALAATALSVIFERAAARRFLTDDPREFVLDEVAGQAVATAILAPSFGLAGVWVGFVAFRIFDVLKPGIEWVERRGWPGKIVWDDLLAGVYGAAAAWVLLATIAALTAAG